MHSSASGRRVFSLIAPVLLAIASWMAAGTALAAPSITFSKTPDGGTIAQNTTATFTYTITNNGGNSNELTQLLDSLPGGTTITWSSPDPECFIDNPVVGVQI